MAKLIIPSNPSRIEACTPRAWMRLRIHDQPVIGMLVGTKDRELLLYVGKNGVLEQAPIGYSNMKFIDYLTQDESVTIYGEAAERTEDDIPTAFKINQECIPPEVGSSDFSRIPNWTVFAVTNSGRGPLWIVLGPDKQDPAVRRSICVGRNSLTHMTGCLEKDMKIWGDRFDSMAAPKEIMRFNKHPNLGDFDSHPFPVDI